MLAGLVHYLIRIPKHRYLNKATLNHPLIISAAALVGWLAVSWLVSSRLFSWHELLPGLLYFLRFAGYVALLILFWLRGQTEKHPQFYNWLVAIFWLVVVGGFLQLLIFPDLRLLERFGFDPHVNRLTGSFLDPNLLAGFLVLSLSTIWSKPKNFLPLLFSALAVLFTFSRSGWLAFLALLLGASLYLKKKWLWLLPIVMLLLIFIVPGFKGRALDLIHQGPTIIAREENLQQGWQLFKKEPFLGFGFDNLRLVRTIAGSSLALERSGATLDNSFLLVAATSGLIGLLFYLWFLWSLLREVFYGLKRPILGVGIVAVVIQSLFVNSLFYSPVLLLLALALSVGSGNETLS
jgi:O-antigen ligase